MKLSIAFSEVLLKFILILIPSNSILHDTIKCYFKEKKEFRHNKSLKDYVFREFLENPTNIDSTFESKGFLDFTKAVLNRDK